MLINTSNINTLRFKKSKFESKDSVYQPYDIPIRPTVDLREWDSLVEDQEQLGSCTGNAVTNAYELMVKKIYPTYFVELSKLFVYYNARVLEGTIDEDSGASIKNAVKGVYNFGVCKEELWPYNIDKFDDKPSPESYKDATNRKLLKYMKVLSIDNLVNAINYNYPVVIGMTIFENFIYLNKDNYVLNDDETITYPIGGHAVTVIGYNLEDKLFLVKNSFGTEWGLNGYFYMSFDYVKNYVFEMWCFDITDQSLI
jgi:C1A family cysteine protease